MKALILAASAAFFVSAQAVELPDEIVEQCAKAGGCIVTIPEGKVYPLAAVQQQIQQLAKDAYLAGKEEGAQTCKRRDV